MFHTQANASKYAYIGMCQYLHSQGVVAVDNQLPTEHLDSLGAMNIEREEFLEIMHHHAGLVVEDAVIPSTEHFRLSL
jgi:leucyl/phenylalanyl-tRNA--protein transferase